MNVDFNLINSISMFFGKSPAIEKALLFGSRARGDNSDRSDYDIAVYGSLNHEEKTELRLGIAELPTLHKIDLVFVADQTDGAFLENIKKEGILIYDKSAK